MAKILFVDDDSVTLELMGQAAKLLGHEAILAQSGDQALMQAKEIRPDLIFLDMMMPNKDGLQVLTELKGQEETTNIPIIILSAGTSRDDAVVAELAGASGYLPKPIPLQTLMDTITRYTAR